MAKWWDRLFRRKSSFDDWIDNQLASGRSMSDLVFVETHTPVEWLRGDGDREGTWAVPSGFSDNELDMAISLAVELGVLDKVNFTEGSGRGGRNEVGKISGERVIGDTHYWLIDFEFDGHEGFFNIGG